jgi:hypothetical protein
MANHDFVSITSYKRWEETKNVQVFGYDWYPGLLEIQEEGKEQHTNTYSQELRIQAPADSKLDYLAGVFLNYYERIPDSLGTELILPPLPPFLPPPSTVPTENYRRVTAKNRITPFLRMPITPLQIPSGYWAVFVTHFLILISIWKTSLQGWLIMIAWKKIFLHGGPVCSMPPMMI